MTTYIFFNALVSYTARWYRLGTFILGLLLVSVLQSCDEFTQTDMPITELNAVAVFEEMNTANAAMANVYAQIRDNGLLTGKNNGGSKELGLYADELTWFGNTSQSSANFYTNTLIPTHPTVADWWNRGYSQIYAANALIEGVGLSEKLTQEQQEQLIGEAKFARGLLHFYILQVYGGIPYVTGTDYTINKSVKRLATATVYDLIIADLEDASALLPEDYLSPERTRVNAYAAKALLARVYLYAGKWAEAANSASAVLNQTELYVWETDLNAVFLKESTGTIWQYAGRSATRNTDDGTTFIFTAAPPNSVALTTTRLNAFEAGDQRKLNWTKGVGTGNNTFYHPNKYKKRGAASPQMEYTVVLRLAEQYLIRAEARARQGDLIGAQEDLNVVRNRAGLGDTTAASDVALLNAILHERQVEFFTEFGHRFMDLKRFGALNGALGFKPDWDATEEHLPIPQAELNLNPNLGSQNPGY